MDTMTKPGSTAQITTRWIDADEPGRQRGQVSAGHDGLITTVEAARKGHAQGTALSTTITCDGVVVYDSATGTDRAPRCPRCTGEPYCRDVSIHRRYFWGDIPTGDAPGRDLAVGDVLWFLGSGYRIDRFEPYTGALLDLLGEGTRIAYSGTWSITVPPHSGFEILCRPKNRATA